MLEIGLWFSSTSCMRRAEGLQIEGDVVDQKGAAVPSALVVSKCRLGDGMRVTVPSSGHADEQGHFIIPVESCPKLLVQAARSAWSDPVSETIAVSAAQLPQRLRLVLPQESAALGAIQFRERDPSGACKQRTITLYREGSINAGVDHRLPLCGSARITVRTGTYRIFDSASGEAEPPMMVLTVTAGSVHTISLP